MQKMYQSIDSLATTQAINKNSTFRTKALRRELVDYVELPMIVSQILIIRYPQRPWFDVIGYAATKD